MAKGILAEVFRLRLSEVDEMMENRFLVEDERRFKEVSFGRRNFGLEG